MVGKITWYNDKLGFGFIESPRGGGRLYFETPKRELFSLGQTVEYEEKVNPKNGLSYAANVKPSGSETVPPE